MYAINFFYRSCLDFYQGPCNILTTELIHKCIHHHTSSVTLINMPWSLCMFGWLQNFMSTAVSCHVSGAMMIYDFFVEDI